MIALSELDRDRNAANGHLTRGRRPITMVLAPQTYVRRS